MQKTSRIQPRKRKQLPGIQIISRAQRASFLLCLFFIYAGATAYAQQQKAAKRTGTGKFSKFHLLPAPQQLDPSSGVATDPMQLRGILLKGGAERPVLYGPLQALPLADGDGKGVILINLTDDASLPPSNEGYRLIIENNHVAISARGQAGLFYGCQTLFQLVEDANDQQGSIPACRITDYPDIPYRAIHLDLKHHVDAAKYYYDMIDRLAAVKVNAIIAEFEDKLRYRQSPVVGSGNAISIDEFAAISRYAKERNIEISPLIQGLGHASFILKHDKYKQLRDTISSDWSFDPMNPDTYALQFSLYEDAMAATPDGKYLHVGGDEVGNLGMSEASKKSGLTPMQLQMRWLNKVSEFARSHNRIPIFWDDMVSKLSNLYRTTWDPEVPAGEVKKTWEEHMHQLEENVSLFPKSCVYMRWNYDAPDIPGNLKALDWYNSHQLHVMAATAAQTMWPMMPRQQSNFQPIKDFCRITAAKKLDGILCTAWDDCSPHFETYWRGLYDFAFFSWHYRDIAANDLHAIFRQRFFAPALYDSAFNFEDRLEEALPFWETALLEKGSRSNYPDSIELTALPDAANKKAWHQRYTARVQQAATELKRYTAIRETIGKAAALARRNRYALEIMNQVNELQVYPSKLILLLDKYDVSEATAATGIRQQIAELVNGFAALRKNYEGVFSKTRLLNNPADYIMDQNHHQHLANGTVNSDWMFVYELAMNKRVTEWLHSL